MTGREFLRMSAEEIKNWIEVEDSDPVINKVKENYKIDDRRKVIKEPIIRIEARKDYNTLIYKVVVEFGDKKTVVEGEMQIDSDILVVNKIRIYCGASLIDSYDRP